MISVLPQPRLLSLVLTRPKLSSRLVNVLQSHVFLPVPVASVKPAMGVLQQSTDFRGVVLSGAPDELGLADCLGLGGWWDIRGLVFVAERNFVG